jgi:hypothetical protein
MMPYRQRQIQTTMQGQSSYQSTTPRYPDLPQEFDGSYLPISAPELQHYELTSYVPGTLVRSCVPGEFEYYGDIQGPGSASLSVCGSSTVAEISPPQSEAGISPHECEAGPNAFAWSIGESYNGPFAQESTMASAYDTYPMEWPMQAPNTPPPEPQISAQMNGAGEPTVCENLGPSALQHMRLDHTTPAHRNVLMLAGSKSRRSPPRPLRPSNGRRNSEDSSDADSTPSKTDNERINYRTDPLYDMEPDSDGFYHCPKKHETKCDHKPVKQKCLFA